MRRWTGLAVAASMAVPVVAQASAGENEWRAGLGASLAPAGLAGLEFGWLHDLTDFWGAGVSLRDRRDFGSLPDGRAAISADVRFVVDALTWIPALGLGIGAAVRNGDQTEVQPYLRAEASVGYRPARLWGVTFHVAADRYGGEDGAYVGTLSVSYVRYGGSGIGLDL